MLVLRAWNDCFAILKWTPRGVREMSLSGSRHMIHRGKYIICRGGYQPPVFVLDWDVHFFGRIVSSPTVRCERFPLWCIAVHCNTFTHTKKAWSIFIGQAFNIHNDYYVANPSATFQDGKAVISSSWNEHFTHSAGMNFIAKQGFATLPLSSYILSVRFRNKTWSAYGNMSSSWSLRIRWSLLSVCPMRWAFLLRLA